MTAKASPPLSRIPKPDKPEPKGCAIIMAGAGDWRGDDAGGVRHRGLSEPQLD